MNQTNCVDWLIHDQSICSTILGNPGTTNFPLLALPRWCTALSDNLGKHLMFGLSMCAKWNRYCNDQWLSTTSRVIKRGNGQFNHLARCFSHWFVTKIPFGSIWSSNHSPIILLLHLPVKLYISRMSHRPKLPSLWVPMKLAWKLHEL